MAEIKLSTPAHFGNRFRFVLFIEQKDENARVIARVEIFEHAICKATLFLSGDSRSRIELVDSLLERCVQWAETRILQAPDPSA